MNSYTLLFLVLLAAVTACRLWLSARHSGHVRRHSDRVPPPFDDRVSLEDHRKAAAYTAARGRLGRIETVFEALLLLVWTLGGGLALLDTLWREQGLGAVSTGVGFLVSLGLIGALLSLPFGLYGTFRIEADFGFNRTTPKLYLADLARSLLISLVIGVPLAAGVLWFMQSSGSLWWLYAWALWAAFVLCLTWAYPRVIAPLFNRFEPLQDAALRERIERLVDRCGFRSRGIFVMDGSRRSSHGNAYFTGLGNAKRIVFFDTLVETLEPAEIEAVLAHELGHFHHHHVTKRLIVMLASGLLALALLGWLRGQPAFFTGLGVPVPSDHVALALFFMVVPLATYFLAPLGSFLSRRHEFEADAFAARNSDAHLLITALVKLYRDNATTLTPDRLHSLFYDSHPPAPVRVAHLERLASSA